MPPPPVCTCAPLLKPKKKLRKKKCRSPPPPPPLISFSGTCASFEAGGGPKKTVCCAPPPLSQIPGSAPVHIITCLSVTLLHLYMQYTCITHAGPWDRARGGEGAVAPLQNCCYVISGPCMGADGAGGAAASPEIFQRVRSTPWKFLVMLFYINHDNKLCFFYAACIFRFFHSFFVTIFFTTYNNIKFPPWHLCIWQR